MSEKATAAGTLQLSMHPFEFDNRLIWSYCSVVRLIFRITPSSRSLTLWQKPSRRAASLQLGTPIACGVFGRPRNVSLTEGKYQGRSLKTTRLTEKR